MISNNVWFLSIFILSISSLIFAQDKMNTVEIGDTVLPFSVNDENGDFWSLEENLNQKFLVVYFYPAALTGG